MGCRLRMGMLGLTALSLILALWCLERIGPPPTVRIDAWWVNKNMPLVQMKLAALAVAAAASGLLIFNRRGWVLAVVLWLLAAAAAVWMYDDRLWIILRVVARHA